MVMETAGLKDGCIAGFGIFQKPYAYVGIRQTDGKKELIMCNNGEVIGTPKAFPGERIWIRARVTDKDFTARFYYSLDGETYFPIGNVLKRVRISMDCQSVCFIQFQYNSGGC